MAATKSKRRGWDVAAPFLNFGKNLLVGGEKPIWEFKDPLGEVARRLAAFGQQCLARGQAWLASVINAPPQLALPAVPRLPAAAPPFPALPGPNK